MTQSARKRTMCASKPFGRPLGPEKAATPSEGGRPWEAEWGPPVVPLPVRTSRDPAPRRPQKTRVRPKTRAASCQLAR
eukprot:5452371-Heterocapsa_arctica.AAC.1